MPIFQIYSLISVLLIIGEIFIPGFVLMPIGLAGLITALVAYFQPEAYWLHAVFFICSSGLILLGLARFREQMSEKRTQSRQQYGVVGQSGTIVALKSDQTPMQVKIFGDVWDVIDSDAELLSQQNLAVGTRVKVVSVQGNRISIELE